MALARRTKAAGAPGHYALAYEAGAFFYHAAWLHGFGGRLLDDAGRPALDSPMRRCASVAFVQQLAAEQLLPPESTGVVATQLFNDGRAAITINGPWFVGEIAPGVPFAVAPLPIVSATGLPAAPLVTIEARAPAGARHAAAGGARASPRWLAGPEAPRVRARSAGRRWPRAPPGTIRRSPAIPCSPPSARSSPATVPMSNAPAMRAVWEPAQQALRQVLRGAAEPRGRARPRRSGA